MIGMGTIRGAVSTLYTSVCLVVATARRRRGMIDTMIDTMVGSRWWDGGRARV
jgi:hypothetical protein